MTDCDAYFDAVYESSYDELLRYVVIKTNRADGVEDIVQTVYHKFYLRIRRRGHKDIEEPKAFLISLTKKELWRHRRRQSAAAAEVWRTDERTETNGADEQAMNRMLADEIWALVRSEPLISYKCFVLYYGFDMPVKSIAESLSLTEEAVKSRLFRTRARVRERFAGWKEV